ncbi:MAG: 4-oxalocrotonate tautomerase family protein [Candidatus Bathyarchaeia archaeon]
MRGLSGSSSFWYRKPQISSQKNYARCRDMPVVQVEMWEGRTDDQKEKLIKAITRAFEEIGVKAEYLTIIIHDVPKSNWGMRGQQASKIGP